MSLSEFSQVNQIRAAARLRQEKTPAFSGSLHFMRGLAVKLGRNASDMADKWRRSRIALPFVNRTSSNPTIYFLCPDFAKPSGGIRVIYRHVDILNEAGLNAAVLHHRPGFRCKWFENTTRVEYLPAVEIGRGDLLVLPEVEVDLLSSVPDHADFVIFNQNSHYTWRRINAEDSRDLYMLHHGLKGVITVSGHNQEMLRLAFPGSHIDRITLSLDGEMFYPGSEPRPHRITYMPRRGAQDARQVLTILKSSGVLADWELVALDGLTQQEVARELRKSRIYLAFTDHEGFGLPAAEAMACGNYVIGNHGFGGKEFFRPEFSAPVENGDIAQFVRAVEKAIDREFVQDGWCGAMGQAASDYIRTTYTPERERESVLAIYERVMKHIAK